VGGNVTLDPLYDVSSDAEGFIAEVEMFEFALELKLGVEYLNILQDRISALFIL